MQPISPEALKLVLDNAPDFWNALRQAKRRRRETGRTARMVIHLDAFSNDPFTLYACLWCAASEQVEILLRAQRAPGRAGVSATTP